MNNLLFGAHPKSERTVSILAEVHWFKVKRGVMSKVEEEVSAILNGDVVYTSDSLLPQLWGPDGYDVPVSKSQFVVEGSVPGVPVKSSKKIGR